MRELKRKYCHEKERARGLLQSLELEAVNSMTQDSEKMKIDQLWLRRKSNKILRQKWFLRIKEKNISKVTPGQIQKVMSQDRKAERRQFFVASPLQDGLLFKQQ